MKWKTIILIISVLLIYGHFFIQLASTRSQIISTADTFDLLISDSLTIQNDQEYVTLSVESGILNGSDTTLDVDTGVGHLLFHSEDTATLAMQLITDRTISIVTENCDITRLNETSYTVTITADQNVEISWGYNLESFADKYTVVGFGLVGIGMMVFAPAWSIRKILSDGLDVESVERIGYAILIFIVGLGLFITFLYW